MTSFFTTMNLWGCYPNTIYSGLGKNRVDAGYCNGRSVGNVDTSSGHFSEYITKRILAFMEIHASKLEIGIQSWNTTNCRDILIGSSTPDRFFPSQPLLAVSHTQPLPEVHLYEQLQEERSPISLKLYLSAETKLVISNISFSTQRHSFSKLELLFS